jgi:type VI secretion system protein ImpF
MAKPYSEQPLLPSVLDRLLDDEPSSKSDTLKSRTQVLREMKQSVRRDLENLLNTRWKATGWPRHLTEMERSLLNYGIPDISGTELGIAERRKRFERTIEQVIRDFEQRLRRVSVRLLDEAESFDRVVKFEINALLRVEPAPEPVTYTSDLEPATGNFDVEVKGGGA